MKIMLRVVQVLLVFLFIIAGIFAMAGVLAKSTGMIVAGVILSLIAIGAFLLVGKSAKSTPLENPRDEFDVSIETIFKDGGQVLSPNCYCLLGIKNNEIQMKTSISQPPIAVLKLSQVTNIGVFTETEIIEKSRNVIGRGVAGAFLFGPVGAIVGGLSGTKNKKRRSAKLFIVINYIPNGEPQPMAMTFEGASPFNKTTLFIDTVKAGQSTQTINL